MAVVKLERRKAKREKVRSVFSLKESQIQKAILDLLAAEHILAIRLNTGAFRDSRGVPVQMHSGGAGVADILAFVHGPWSGNSARFQRVLWIEVKRPGKEQTPEQISFQRRVEAEGHFYLVARSSEQVLAWLREHGVSR